MSGGFDFFGTFISMKTKTLQYKGISLQDLPYDLAIEALETCPINRNYLVMARVVCEQHKKIPWKLVETILEYRIQKERK